MGKALVVQGSGTPTDIQRHPQISTNTRGAGSDLSAAANSAAPCPPCLYTWEVAAGGSLPCGGTGDNGAASLINSGSGC